MAKLLRVFFNADLRNSHDGLGAMAKKEKIDLKKLSDGEYVLFINTERNKLKLVARDNVLAYLRLETGKVDLRTISLIPKAFQGSGRIDYESQLKKVLCEKLRIAEM